MRITIALFVILSLSACKQYAQEAIIQVGAEQTQDYLPFLKGKNVAIVANQSSIIHKTHLLDSLLSLNINIIKIFSPEHGFRGNADAGEIVSDNIDKKTGLPVISMYGKNKKPGADKLTDVDIMIFDLQDVGVRFYTYISSLHYVMEVCAENNIPLIVLDRPNPNGFYIDGPVLEKGYKSFIGMHPVPIVYGMTIGEYAKMINGQEWLKNGIQCNLTVIKCRNYTHSSLYELPVKPSPNLPDMASVYLYPSLALFEGTIMSVGRGTELPFHCYGHPDFKIGTHIFKPISIEGAAKHPKYENQICYGINLTDYIEVILSNKQLVLSWIINSYSEMGRDDFFKSSFGRLAGTGKLQKQIEQGLSENEIRKTWQAGLDKFKLVRKKYLLYDDFQ